ncbi:hypothetical protein TNCV_615291 [Trichonephila clavipes]|nr:hypothetical protein TNCV_615291 [Trichonephila clavipes]
MVLSRLSQERDQIPIAAEALVPGPVGPCVKMSLVTYHYHPRTFYAGDITIAMHFTSMTIPSHLGFVGLMKNCELQFIKLHPIDNSYISTPGFSQSGHEKIEVI